MNRQEIIQRLGRVCVKDKDKIIFYYPIIANISEQAISQVVDVVNLILENKIDIQERFFEQTVKVNFSIELSSKITYADLKDDELYFIYEKYILFERICFNINEINKK